MVSRAGGWGWVTKGQGSGSEIEFLPPLTPPPLLPQIGRGADTAARGRGLGLSPRPGAAAESGSGPDAA